MENLCWGAPILPGKLEQWHRFNDEVQGPRREEHAASRREMGIHREVPRSELECAVEGDHALLEVVLVAATAFAAD